MADIRRPSSPLLKRVVLIATSVWLCGFLQTTPNSDQSEIVTSDVSHFWRAFDDAANVPVGQRTAIYRKEYFDRGSQGLRDFVAARRVTPEAFSSHVEEERAYYERVRPLIGKVVDQKPVIQNAFRRLKALYPNIKFPPHVYFVVGPQRGAGMNSDNGIVLAAEMFATPPGTPYSYNKVYPEYVPFAVVHETIHFNQTFQTNDSSTLIQNVVSEGTADFIASLVLAEPAVRQSTDRWQYGCQNEAALAARFAGEEGATKTPWIFDHSPATGWPPDMGYWLGYRIDQTFYDHAPNKTNAIRAMLQVTDFKAFVAASGYPVKRPVCVPERPVVLHHE